MGQFSDKHHPDASPPAFVRDEIEVLAKKLGNAILSHDDDYKIQSATKDLLEYVDESLLKYGKSVYLLATKADFINGYEKRLPIYAEAFNKAVHIGDSDNVFIIASDMLIIYEEQLLDVEFVNLFGFVEKYVLSHGLEMNQDYLNLKEEHKDSYVV